MSKQIKPPQLKSGDTAVVVSPSSTIADLESAARTACVHVQDRLGLKVRFSSHALGRHFYSSGTAADRADDLMAAFRDSACRAIFLSMGGATAIDVVELLDYTAIAEDPKMIAGISDSSTVLNAITARTGLLTCHGFELLDYARHQMPYTTRSIQQVWFDGWCGGYQANPDWRDLEGERTTYVGRRAIRPGQARGIAVGGNSEAFLQLVDTDYCPPLDGAILFVETYRLQKRHIHATLTQLRLRKVFDRIAGLVVGYCLGSDAAGMGNERDIADLTLEATVGFDFPVIQIGEIGHQVENLSLPLGATVGIDSDPVALSLLEPAVDRPD